MTTSHAPFRPRSLLTSEGRAAQPFRVRVGAAFGAVVLLHLIGLGLLTYGVAAGAAGALGVGVAGLAYLRGLVHSFDFDHVAMIDNSTRKFVAEGRDPASVGLAFSAGHSTVVVVTGIGVIAGAGAIRSALDENSTLATVLGIIGLSISGLYLILVALANLATFVQAVRLKRALNRDPDLQIPPDALTPRGPAARVLTAPLRQVRQPWHVYLVGVLFSLGFDTSSQIGLLMLTAGAALAGAPPIALLSLPILFAAAMTLGDTSNGLMMLRMYRAAQHDVRRRISYNIAITGVGIVAGLIVGLLAVTTILTEVAGVTAPPIVAIAGLDTEYAGYLLAALFAIIGIAAAVLWRRSRTVGPVG